MLFEEKYPDANEQEQYEGGNYIWVPKADNCYVCGRLTHFVEINLGAHMCSPECEEKFFYDAFRHSLGTKDFNLDF